MSAEVDVLDFVERALLARGSLCERGEGRLVSVLPPEAAASLALDETVTLAAEAAPGAVFAGLGSEVLERLVAAESGTVRVASAVLGDPGGRPSPEPKAAFTAVNGVVEAGPLEARRAYVHLFGFAWRAECDEVEAGLLTVALAEGSGAAMPTYAEPAELFGSERLEVSGAPREFGQDLARLAGRAGERARATLLVRLRGLVESLARRKRRDGERLAAYYGELRAEMRGRADRGGAGALAGKLARLHEEEAAKVADLEERYRLRVRLDPVLLLRLEVPVRTARLRVRRRKLDRSIDISWHPAVRAWEPLVCESCGEETRVFAACDAAAHILCRGCHDGSAGAGRRPCRRCSSKADAGGPAPLLVTRVRGTAREERDERASAIRPATLPAGGGSSPLPVPPAPRPPADRADAADTARAAPTADPGAPAEVAPSNDGQLALPFGPEDSVWGELGGAPGMTVIEIAARSRLPVEVVRPVLRRLVREGRAVVEGRTRGTRYRRADAAVGTRTDS